MCVWVRVVRFRACVSRGSYRFDTNIIDSVQCFASRHNLLHKPCRAAVVLIFTFAVIFNAGLKRKWRKMDISGSVVLTVCVYATHKSFIDAIKPIIMGLSSGYLCFFSLSLSLDDNYQFFPCCEKSLLKRCVKSQWIRTISARKLFSHIQMCWNRCVIAKQPSDQKSMNESTEWSSECMSRSESVFRLNGAYKCTHSTQKRLFWNHKSDFHFAQTPQHRSRDDLHG